MPAITQSHRARWSEPVRRSPATRLSPRSIWRNAHCIGRRAAYASLDAASGATTLAGPNRRDDIKEAVSTGENVRRPLPISLTTAVRMIKGVGPQRAELL